MCVVTGVPDPSASALAKPVDKYPALLPILKAMATVAQGGQVLCASSTYTLINSRLTDIARRVPEQPNAPFNSMQSALHGWDTLTLLGAAVCYLAAAANGSQNKLVLLDFVGFVVK